MTSIAEKLHTAIGPGLRARVSLAPYTWMRVGGLAEFLVEAVDEDMLVHVREVSRELGVPFTFLAGGSNVFADDDGLEGLVLVNRAADIEWDDAGRTVSASGGYDLDRLVSEVAGRGWGDLTFAAGIPGTVGGGLVGGAGAYGKLLYEFVHTARLLRPNGAVETVPIEALGVRYRESDALDRGDIVLAVRFRPFDASDRAGLLERIAEIKSDRRRKHPPENLPCAGSFFKNLPPAQPGDWRVPAGKLLDECGAKGMCEGGAAVFENHANIIVNTGNATARDINTLADRMADAVREKRGVELVREVRYLSNRVES